MSASGARAAVVRRATPEDGPLLRALRLRALDEDGDAFASSVEREQSWPAERWSTWPQRHAVFLAEARAGEGAGLVAGFLDEERPGAARLIAMWVAPEGRGAGAGRALVEAVAAWARAAGATTLLLDVMPANTVARGLYERAGFAPVDTAAPLDAGCPADAITLARRL